MTGIKGAEATAALEEVAAGVYANPCDADGNDDNAGDSGDAFEMVKEDAAAVVVT